MTLKKILIFISIAAVFFTSLPNQSYAKPSKTKASQNFSDEEDFENYASNNEEEVYDPLEKYNRKIFSFNDFVDHYFLEYVAKTYRKEIPKPARDSVRNFLTNIYSPVSAFNSFLQGKSDNGLATLSNFLINSTVGVLGIFNVAEEKGIRYHREDFGQTLGHYGIKSGPYLVVPFIGPSSMRDFTGLVTDQVVSPASYNVFKIGGKYYLIGDEALIGITLTNAVDTRESLIDIIDGVKKDSFDYYATLRSAYTQKRNNEIKN